MIRLRLTASDGEPQELGIDDPVIGIGRDDTNQVIIDDGKASRYHCQIERDADSWKVVDNASANGTMVNGSLINYQRLKVGDVITIGKTTIEVLDVAAGRPSRRARAVSTPDDDQGAGRPARRSSARTSSTSEVSGYLGLVLLAVLIAGWVGWTQIQRQFQKNSMQGARYSLARDEFEAALARCDEIPAGSRYWSQAQALRADIEVARKKFDNVAMEKQATGAFARLEEWQTLKGVTRSEMQGYVNNFLARFGDSSYAEQARAIMGSFGDEDQDKEKTGGTTSNGGTGSKLSPFDRAMRDADNFMKQKEYGSALEVLRDFWSDNTGTEAELANARIKSLREEVQKTWKDMKFTIETHIAAGKNDLALELLAEAEMFGIESIGEEARRMAEKLSE